MTYLGTQPNDVKKNTGLYTPSEILQLEKDGNWGGSLELIEEQTVTSGDTVDFTNLGNYDVHYLTYENLQASGTTELQIRVSNDNGSTFESTNYQYAIQYMNAGGTFSEVKSTSYSSFRLGNRVGNNRAGNGYLYLYNLLDSSKYSFCTSQSASLDTDAGANGRFQFGGSTYTVAETINAIRCFISSSYAFNETGYIKLYGVKQI
jgi:hypothetical protein